MKTFNEKILHFKKMTLFFFIIPGSLKHINGITNKKIPFDDPLSVNQDSWIISDSFCVLSL